MPGSINGEVGQILTAGPWGPTPPGNPLVPGSPWKQKTLGVHNPSRVYVYLYHRIMVTSVTWTQTKVMSKKIFKVITISRLSAQKNNIEIQCCVLTAAPGLPLPYGRHRKAN